MEGTGWRRWLGFGVFGIIVVGLALIAAGWVVGTLFFRSCGC
jgi:hypothetical protein